MDAWSHRATSMRCRSCMFYVPKMTERELLREKRVKQAFGKDSDRDTVLVNELDEARINQLGRCRRHAPAVGQGWPAVFDDDWCGDHKLDENKR